MGHFSIYMYYTAGYHIEDGGRERCTLVFPQSPEFKERREIMHAEHKGLINHTPHTTIRTTCILSLISVNVLIDQ